MDKIIIVALATLVIALVVDSIRLRYSNYNLKIIAGQAIIDQVALKDAINNELKNGSSKADEAKDSYDAMINFLSTSRELAFEYIENSQKTVKKFVDKIGPHVDYYKTYGGVVSSPHDSVMQDLVAEFSKLKDLLPEENEGNDRGEVWEKYYCLQ